jgi:fructokinase
MKHKKESTSVNPKFLSFGEIIYDRINDEFFLGGAPLSFAWFTNQMEVDTTFVSSVGNDAIGRKAISEIKKTGMQTFVNLNELSTGTDEVNESGGFRIICPAAWESITSPTIELKDFDLLYVGTLAQKTPHNQNELTKILSYHIKNIFVDLNLRHPFYSKQIIENSLKIAAILKVNHEEWNKIKKSVGVSTPIELRKKFNISCLAITKGSLGASLFTDNNDLHYEPSKINTLDPTGAGVAFSAVLATGAVKGIDPTKTLELACEAAALVVSKIGAQAHLPENIRSYF